MHDNTMKLISSFKKQGYNYILELVVFWHVAAEINGMEILFHSIFAAVLFCVGNNEVTRLSPLIAGNTYRIR